MPHQSSTKLLIARVSSDQRGVQSNHKEEIIFTEDHVKQLNFYHDDLTIFTNILIANFTPSIYYENGGFRCSVSAELSSFGNEPVYRLVAYSGTRSYAGVRNIIIEICGVVACADEKLSSCGYKPSFQSKTTFKSISISASSQNDLLSYPIAMTSELLPVSGHSFYFNNIQSEENSHISMVLKTSQSDLITFALFRNTEID